jgi:AcrR family transcriptional regulator
VLTRDRVVAEALAIISAGGAAALSMRALATRLGVVPAALYRHVGSKEQLYDLVLDRVLAEVDCQADPALPWTGQVTALARRLRAVLEDHPGIAALLQTRDPTSPPPSPWPRRSSRRCTPPACPAARPPWPSG